MTQSWEGKRRPKTGPGSCGREKRPTWSCKQTITPGRGSSAVYQQEQQSSPTSTLYFHLSTTNIYFIFLLVFFQRKVCKTDWQNSDYNNWKENGVKSTFLFYGKHPWDKKVLKSSVSTPVSICDDVLSSWRLKKDVTVEPGQETDWYNIWIFVTVCPRRELPLGPNWSENRTRILAGKFR